MSIRYTILNDGLLVLERYSGRIKLTDILSQINTLATNGDIKPGAVNIADFRDATFADFDVSEVEKLVEARSESVEKNNIEQLAVIFNDSEGFERVSQYEALMTQQGVPVIVSSSMANLCRILKLDEATIESHLWRIAVSVD